MINMVMYKGNNGFIILLRWVFVIVQVINNIVLIGGEYNLIDRLSMIMILNCKGDIFNCMVIGRKIGVKINIVGVMFRNVFIIISNRLISSRIIIGLLLIFSKNVLMFCGIFLKDNIYDMVVEVLISSIMIVVVFVDLSKIFGSCLILIF